MKKYILILIMAVMTLNVSAKNFSFNAGYNLGSQFNGDVEGDVDSSFSVGGKYHIKVNESFSWGPVVDYKFDSKLEGTDSSNVSGLFYGIFSNYKFNNGIYVNASVGFNSPSVDTNELDEAFEFLYQSTYGGTWDASTDFNGGFSYIVGIGYEINEQFAVEANIKHLGGNFDTSITDGTTTDSGSGDYSFNTFTLGAVAKF